MGLSQRVLTLHDQPMWDSIEQQRFALQHCDDCSTVRYPPGPICPHCLSLAASWKPLSGRATILSWVVFHRQYFDDFPPPYNSVAVQIAEGPIVVSNLIGDEPEGSWIGAEVEFVYRRQGERMQHAVRLLLSGPVAGGSDQTAP
jgi:uncharacterized OB-fold protein